MSEQQAIHVLVSELRAVNEDIATLQKEARKTQRVVETWRGRASGVAKRLHTEYERRDRIRGALKELNENYLREIEEHDAQREKTVA